jgi:hypothetical protein
MKIRIDEKQRTAIKNLIDALLIWKGHIIVIKEAVFAIDQNHSDRIYVTELKVLGWFSDTKYITSYSEEFCVEFLKYNLYEMRKTWLDMKEQLEGFNFKLEPIVQKTDAERIEEGRLWMDVMEECLRNGNSLMALKIYKENTGKSLQECKAYIMSIKDNYK